MERGDKMLKNGIYLFSICQLLTKIWQVETCVLICFFVGASSIFTCMVWILKNLYLLQFSRYSKNVSFMLLGNNFCTFVCSHNMCCHWKFCCRLSSTWKYTRFWGWYDLGWIWAPQKIFFQNLDGGMARGDKLLKSGVYLISTCPKLTEILQVQIFLVFCRFCQKCVVGRG